MEFKFTLEQPQALEHVISKEAIEELTAALKNFPRVNVSESNEISGALAELINGT